MSDNDTLLAYLVPRLTNRIEDNATEALAFILNKSAASRAALNDLLGDTGILLEPFTRFQTQVLYQDGCKPDMIGYTDGVTQLVVESKFWASLLQGQARGYIKHLEDDAPGVLLFICPESRRRELWGDVCAELESGQEPLKVADLGSVGEARVAEVYGASDQRRRVILVSWLTLLDRLAAAPVSHYVKSDIDQLRGLTRVQDSPGFQPLVKEVGADDFEDRDIDYRRLIRDAVAEGKRQKVLNVRDLNWGITESYRQRFFSLEGVKPEVALRVDYTESRYRITPFWFTTYSSHWQSTPKPDGTIELAGGKQYLSPVQVNTEDAHGKAVSQIVSQMRDLQKLLRT